MSISFKDRVAIVTGAGGGLGRSYALEAAGGEAMSNGASVTEYEQMEEMVARAKEKWGGVHILINNAGVLRDKSFAKMEPADFEFVAKVHLFGSAYATKACWETMREQAYGRVLMTTSSSGLFGNFGQANYGAAKLGLVGLAKTLYLEGAKYNVRVNSLAPLAGTRMTEDIIPEQAFAMFSPENVVPAALYLVSEDAPNNAIVGAGVGGYHSAWVTMNTPVILPDGERTVEGFAAHWADISNREGDFVPQSGMEQTQRTLAEIQKLAAKQG